jgi:hypothetical protein
MRVLVDTNILLPSVRFTRDPCPPKEVVNFRPYPWSETLIRDGYTIGPTLGVRLSTVGCELLTGFLAERVGFEPTPPVMAT